MRIRWRGFELPTRCVPVDEEITSTYGKFIVEPFERGFGHTLGNGFRRILLSSIEGSAVVSVRFSGVNHEFSTVTGIYEDVQEMVLNIKEICFKLDDDTSRADVIIEKKGEGEVLAGDIKCPPEVEVVNPDHIIAHITGKSTAFKLEMTVEKGRGYLSAEDNEIRMAAAEQPLGYIAIASTFSPILRVRYSVDDTRVGKITNYDKLLLELWTDGTISPQDALLESANIYKKHLNCFTRFRDLGEELDEEKKPGLSDERLKKAKDQLKQKFDTPITDLGLSVRTINCLTSEGLNSVGDIVEKPESEITKIRNFGKTSAKELKTKLQELGLAYQMSLEEEMRKLEERGVE